MASRSRGDGNYTNPCLTMHQPWASLLVHGIKRIEGRSWPSPLRGRLWIHAAGKIPEPGTIEAMENFYRELYALNGVTDLKFPEHYPVSRLLGCVEVVGCVTLDELVSWEDVPYSVRVEGQTPFCWLCEQPQKLLVPFEMRGNQGVYNLEKRILEGAIRGLSPVRPPFPVKFPLPNPRDAFSLKPGSVVRKLSQSSTPSTMEDSSPTLMAAIAGARTAATQFSKKSYSPPAPSRQSERSNISRERSNISNERSNISGERSKISGERSNIYGERSNIYAERSNNSSRTRNKAMEDVRRLVMNNVVENTTKR